MINKKPKYVYNIIFLIIQNKRNNNRRIHLTFLHIVIVTLEVTIYGIHKFVPTNNINAL